MSLEDELIRYARAMQRTNGDVYVRKCMSLWELTYGSDVVRKVQASLGAQPAPVSPAHEEDL